MTLSQLDAQQLMGAKRTIENDVQRFAESLAFFNKSAQIYLQAGAAVKNLTDSKEGACLISLSGSRRRGRTRMPDRAPACVHARSRMPSLQAHTGFLVACVCQCACARTGQGLLLPLTQSLYVSGEVASVDQVLIDIGTNYYVEVCAGLLLPSVVACRPVRGPGAGLTCLLPCVLQMTTEQAQEYLRRKLQKLQVSMNEVQQVRPRPRVHGVAAPPLACG